MGVEVLFTSFRLGFSFFFLNMKPPVRWADGLQPLLNISEHGRESQATFVSPSALTDLQTPTKGEMDPLTLVEKVKVGGVLSLVRAKLIHSTFQG